VFNQTLVFLMQQVLEQHEPPPQLEGHYVIWKYPYIYLSILAATAAER
jgi:hypothetical protein